MDNCNIGKDHVTFIIVCTHIGIVNSSASLWSNSLEEQSAVDGIAFIEETTILFLSSFYHHETKLLKYVHIDQRSVDGENIDDLYDLVKINIAVKNFKKQFPGYQILHFGYFLANLATTCNGL